MVDRAKRIAQIGREITELSVEKQKCAKDFKTKLNALEKEMDELCIDISRGYELTDGQMKMDLDEEPDDEEEEDGDEEDEDTEDGEEAEEENRSGPVYQPGRTRSPARVSR